MKILRILFLFCFTTNTLESQNFEGILKYSVDFEVSKEMEQLGYTRAFLISKLKEDNLYSEYILYYYKDHDYVIETDDYKANYIGKDKTIYTRMRGQNVVVATDVSKYSLSQPEVCIDESKELILKRKCKKVSFEWKSNAYEYYYSPDFLPLNPLLYESHNYEMFYDFLKISNSLPLRIVKKVGGIITTINLIEVNESDLNHDLFKIPKMTLSEDLSGLNSKIFTTEN